MGRGAIARAAVLALLLRQLAREVAGQEDRPIVTASLGSLSVEVSAFCAVGSRLVGRHPSCGGAAWFPAEVIEDVDEYGNLTVLYGREPNLAQNLWKVWTNATSVSVTELHYFPCRDQDWPDGVPGRGFAYQPQGCNSTVCSSGCRVQPATGCEQGEFIGLGENCTVVCGGAGDFPSRVNVTCNAQAPLEDRSFVCQRYSQWCKENQTAGNNTDCVIRQTSTTTTTVAAAKDRYLRGCSELEALGPGVLGGAPEDPALPIGMPQVLVSAGGSYLEIQLTGVGDQAGWADIAWSHDGPDRESHEWLTPPATVVPVIVGIAVRFLGKETAEVYLFRDGMPVRDAYGRASLRISFEQALLPIALVRDEASWFVTYKSWTHSPPPNAKYSPLTGQAYPERCRWPPDFERFASPPRCRGDFEVLNTSEDCARGAFELGLSDISPSEAPYTGWPPGCFHCVECDLAGDLYLNLERGAQNTSTEVMSQAPDTGAVCRRIDPRRTSTATTTTAGLRTTTTALPPRFRLFGSGNCSDGYETIEDPEGCAEAALALELDDTTPKRVTLESGAISMIVWPQGCFQCPFCDDGSLYLNEVAGVNANASANASGNASGNVGANASAGSNTSAGVNASAGGGAGRRISSKLVPESLCRAPASLLTTAAPSSGGGGGAAAGTTRPRAFLQVEVPDYSDRTTTTAMTTTTTTFFVLFEVDLKGIVTCEDPYELDVDLETLAAWVMPVVFAASGCVGCCCCCCACCLCWIFGVCDWLHTKFTKFMDAHPKLKRSCCCRGFYCFMRILAKWCSCCVGAIENLSPRLSPRLQGLSPRGLRAALSPRSQKKAEEDMAHVLEQRSSSKGTNGSDRRNRSKQSRNSRGGTRRFDGRSASKETSESSGSRSTFRTNSSGGSGSRRTGSKKSAFSKKSRGSSTNVESDESAD